MSRPATSPPPPELDCVTWFARLERAVREQDFLIANEARQQLSRLGWIVRHNPKGERPCQNRHKAPHKAAGPGGEQ
jgi:hypothetical protein